MEYGGDKYQTVHVDINKVQRRYFYRFAKRIFDFFASLFGLLLLSPLLVVIALLIKIEDPKGKVIYSQIRVGQNQVPFRMYKFRSMVSNADELLNVLLKNNEVSGAMFKMHDDPRITKIGKFIRKYSIDELPQLVNVMIGQMSLVGPRPPLPREVEQYSDYDKQRLIVKPGCTGLWQATSRNSVGFEKMVVLDLTYVKRQGIILDIYILCRTLLVFIKPNGAY